jgi:hypothetical protein
MSATALHGRGYTARRVPPAQPSWRRWLNVVACAADHLAVTAIRLALLGAVVWGGTAIVRHVTATLQQIAGEPVPERLAGVASR